MKSFLGNFYRHLAIFFWSHWTHNHVKMVRLCYLVTIGALCHHLSMRYHYLYVVTSGSPVVLPPTPTLIPFIGVTNAHVPSSQPTACRFPTCSLTTAAGSNQAKGKVSSLVLLSLPILTNIVLCRRLWISSEM